MKNFILITCLTFACSLGFAQKGKTPTAAPKRAPIDTSKFVLVDGGTFKMGTDQPVEKHEAPTHPVSLNSFYIAKTEVTFEEYDKFCAATKRDTAPSGAWGRGKQPVFMVSWRDAVAYCNWLSGEEGLTPAYENRGGKLAPVTPITNGYRLPTEAEWEWIARGADGVPRKYPWGDTLPVPPGAGNFADRNAQPLVPTFLADLDDGHAATAPVGSYAPNPAGFFDLGGNVAEWTHDVYTVQPATTATTVDPVALGDGSLRVMRGSSWRHSTVTELRVAFRDYGDGRRNDLGFRIARYAQ